MPPSFFPYAFSAALLLGGCHSVTPATDEAEKRYAQEYRKTVNEASTRGVLDTTSTTAKRLHAITDRMLAQVKKLCPDSSQWPWEMNLIKNDDLNASSGPGGKIIVHKGLIDRLELTDDEVAAMMGNLIASAFNEMPQAYGSSTASGVLDDLSGRSDNTRMLADLMINASLREKTRRSNEERADLLGLELAARAGYNPAAAVTLWQKVIETWRGSKNEPMSMGPYFKERMASLKAAVPKVMPLYQNARGF